MGSRHAGGSDFEAGSSVRGAGTVDRWEFLVGMGPATARRPSRRLLFWRSVCLHMLIPRDPFYPYVVTALSRFERDQHVARSCPSRCASSEHETLRRVVKKRR